VSWIQNSKPPVVPIPGIGRRRDRDDDRFLQALDFAVEACEHGPRILRFRRFRRVVAFLEILERHEEAAGIGLEAAVEQAVAGDHRPCIDARYVGQDRVHLLGHRLRAVQARRFRHDDRGHHVALVLVRDEARRQHGEQVVDAPEKRAAAAKRPCA
jgi:hypothetical protein